MNNKNKIKNERMKKKYEYKPTGSQLNPDSLDSKLTEYQLWHNGIMLTLIPRLEAIGKIRNGSAFVITGQAIGSMKDGIATS